MSNKLLRAAYFSYNAQKAEAVANLDVLFKNSVGIGEHTDLLTEVKKWTESLSQAEENIQSLKNNFDEYGNFIPGEKKWLKE